jgi:hypothetical protein
MSSCTSFLSATLCGANSVGLTFEKLRYQPQAIPHDGEVRQVGAEVLPALPAPQIKQPLCVGGHKREAHPGASNSAASSPFARLTDRWNNDRLKFCHLTGKHRRRKTQSTNNTESE